MVGVADSAPRQPATSREMESLSELAELARLQIDSGRLINARLSEFVEITTDWLWETDAEHRLTYFSQSRDPITHGPIADVMGLRPWELPGIDPDDPMWSAHRADIAARRPFRNVICTATDVEGAIMYLSVSGKPMYDGEGTFIGYRGASTDITAQRDAEAVARERDRMFHRIVETTTEGVWLIDAEGITRYVNARMASMLGQLPQDVVGRPFWDFVDGDAMEHWRRRQQGIAEQHEFLLPRPDGSSIWTLINSNPIFDEDGRFAGVLSMVADIDERKRAEERLAASEAQFRYLFEKNPNPMWVYEDGSMRFLEVNDAAVALYGYGREELLSMTILDIRTPEEAARVLEIVPTFPRTGYWLGGVWQHRAKDGRPITVEVVSDDMEYEGRPAYIVAVRDVSEQLRAEAALRESEGRFRQIADSVPGILWLTDSEGRLTFLSKTFEEFSKQPAERYYGQMTTGNAHPDDRDAASAQWEAAVRARRPLSYEYRVRRHDGVYRWHLDTCFPRFDDQGRFLGYIGMLTDIEDRRALGDQLHQAQKMQAVGQLTGGVAHDFNNLLTVILGNVEMLAEQLTDPRLKRLADATQDAAERSAALVQRLLAFSRRQALKPTRIDVKALVDGMQDLLLRTLGEDIDISFSCAAELWPATADRTQLEAALLNLAVNARDAMVGGGRLTIEAANVQIDDAYAAAELEVAPGAYVMIAVSDTGSGMTPETRHHAFEPFFTTKDVGKGSGLGLSMVYGFIKQSGGHVTLYSEVGQGTTVKMYLPRLDDRVDHAAAPTEAPSPATGQETILVVEDDDRVRAYVVEQLSGLGYHVIEAENGPAALELLERSPDVALLFTDVVMPGGMNGRQLADAARRRRPDLKVLFTTGYTENAIVHHGRLDPGIELLGKPFSRAALAAKVRVVLDTRD
jgi:PAS domain S-box-containing protein